MKKAIKIALYSILGVLILTLVGSYFSYKNYWADDPVVQVDSSNLAYFHETYNDCRSSFIESVEGLLKIYDSAKIGKIIVPSKVDNDLSIDWFYIPAQKHKDKLLILNSGLHGIEGYTGSAIQQMFIEKFLKQHLPDNMGVLLIHGLNPYGFKYHRKVTENNVDLNRNCLLENQTFDIKNDGYAELTDMLMPSEPVNLNSLGNQFFYVTAIYKIIKESMPVLRQAALQGQYDFDKGFYYGGKEYEAQIKLLKPLLIDKIDDYKVMLNVDLHTGYGERAKLHPFIDKPEDTRVLNGIETILKGVKIDWGGGKDFYTISGEYVVWSNSLVPNVLCIPIPLEFGTLNSQKTFGSLKSMQIMIVENQGAHHGYKNKRNEEKTKHLFDELYYPESAVWRSKVISDSYEMMSLMMKNYNEFGLPQN